MNLRQSSPQIQNKSMVLSSNLKQSFVPHQLQHSIQPVLSTPLKMVKPDSPINRITRSDSNLLTQVQVESKQNQQYIIQIQQLDERKDISPLVNKSQEYQFLQKASLNNFLSDDSFQQKTQKKPTYPVRILSNQPSYADITNLGQYISVQPQQPIIYVPNQYNQLQIKDLEFYLTNDIQQKNEIIILRKESQLLRAEHQNLRQENQQITKERDQLFQKNNIQLQQLKQLEKQNSQLNDIVLKLEQELNQVKDFLKKNETVYNQQKVHSVTTQNYNLEYNLQKKNKELEEKDAQIQMLQLKLDHVQQILQQNNNNQKPYQDLIEQNQLLNQKLRDYNKLKQDHSNLKNEIEEIKQQNQKDGLGKIKFYEVEVKRLRKQLTTMQNKISTQTSSGDRNYNINKKSQNSIHQQSTDQFNNNFQQQEIKLLKKQVKTMKEQQELLIQRNHELELQNMNGEQKQQRTAGQNIQNQDIYQDQNRAKTSSCL